MYLGDSENDNPAFKKADVSIGINSDVRLKPNLKCKYNLKYENLTIFLKNLAIITLNSQNHFYVFNFILEYLILFFDIHIK